MSPILKKQNSNAQCTCVWMSGCLCSAIRRFRHASNPLGSSVGQLQCVPPLQGIRKLDMSSSGSNLIQKEWKNQASHELVSRKKACLWSDTAISSVHRHAFFSSNTEKSRSPTTYSADAYELPSFHPRRPISIGMDGGPKTFHEIFADTCSATPLPAVHEQT